MKENGLSPAAGSSLAAGSGASRKPIWGAFVGVAAATPLAVVLYGYTVDDALITARVASHLAAGQGYRFNVSAPVTDAVTPLGFAQLLALAGPGDALIMLERARLLGLVAWLTAAALLGWLAERSRGALPGALSVLPLLVLSAPLAAWAGAGMETGLVTALCTLALVPHRAAPLVAGVAAGLRPELLPWALVLGVGRALAGQATPGLAVLRAIGLAAGPAVVVALVRLLSFGALAPLAATAKPSDLTHGLRYAAASFVFGGAPLLLLAPRAIQRALPETRVLVAAAIAHFVSLALVGGDWMALFRLLVPVLPTILLAAVQLAATSAAPWLWARALLGSGLSLLTLVGTGLPARHVLEHRLALIERARGVLQEAPAVATLDAGWVGAATDRPIVDLAGVTDPVIAALPGGHTSKRIPQALIEARRADLWVLLLAPGAPPDEQDWRQSPFARVVERRLARFEIANDYELVATLPLGGTTQSYVVLRRSRAERDPARPAIP